MRRASESGCFRNTRARPLLESLHYWLEATLAAVSRKSELAAAIRYALGRWRALLRYCEDGRIEIGRVENRRSDVSLPVDYCRNQALA
jgi:hypothetical protein